MSGHHPWSEIGRKRDRRLSAEQRAWDEYLAWTRNADPKEYALTEDRAWKRLERALLWFGVVPYRVSAAPPSADADSTAREEPLSSQGGER